MPHTQTIMSPEKKTFKQRARAIFRQLGVRGHFSKLVMHVKPREEPGSGSDIKTLMGDCIQCGEEINFGTRWSDVSWLMVVSFKSCSSMPRVTTLTASCQNYPLSGIQEHFGTPGRQTQRPPYVSCHFPLPLSSTHSCHTLTPANLHPVPNAVQT